MLKMSGDLLSHSLFVILEAHLPHQGQAMLLLAMQTSIFWFLVAGRTLHASTIFMSLTCRL